MSQQEQPPRLFKELDEFVAWLDINGIEGKASRESIGIGIIYLAEYKLEGHSMSSIQTSDFEQVMRWCEDSAIQLMGAFERMGAFESMNEIVLKKLNEKRKLNIKMKYFEAGNMDADLEENEPPEGVIFNENQKETLAEIARPCGGRYTRLRLSRIGEDSTVQIRRDGQDEATSC
jgi:hypothetical protein